MTNKDDSLALLPRGFVDLLPPYAEGEARSIRTLIDGFSAFGYQRIKPPLLEFEECLLAPGPGGHLASETFRLMDPMSHRMLGIRSDVTAQISRIVSSRLVNEDRPLRLTYTNDVLRTSGGQIRTNRQFTQVGCELIGASSGIESDVEICVLALLGLKALGVVDITLDLTIPGFVSHLLADIDAAERSVIEKAVARRDRDALLAHGGVVANIIARSIDASGRCDQGFLLLEVIEFDAYLDAHITHLKNVCSAVEQAMDDLGIDDVFLTIDMLEQDGFEYHKGLGFTLFASGIRGELGRGGCYDVCFGAHEDKETARGFTLYMDSISDISARFSEPDRVFVSCDQPWSVMTELQAQGWIVVRGTDAQENPVRCTHIYKDGNVTQLK